MPVHKKPDRQNPAVNHSPSRNHHAIRDGGSRLSGGAITAWEFARAWPRAELIVIADSGHTGSAAMQKAVHAALGRLYTTITERMAIG
jgi:hypothetical protein